MRAHQAAYGFRVSGIEDSDSLAVHGAERWPLLRFEQRVERDRESPDATLSDQEASISTPAGRLALDRASSRVAVHADKPIEDAELVHPCLWPAAAVFARWHGAETLHGGAFATEGSAWAVLGDRGAGKSSLLATFALAGHPVLADDLLVVRGKDCFAGPRCIDLRPRVASVLGIVPRCSVVRATRRRRLHLPAVNGKAPLEGFVYLAWGNRFALERLSPAEHLGLLVNHRRIAVLGANVDLLLELAGLPALRLSRPRDGESLERSLDLVLGGLQG